jgi:hypothetical protein
VVAFAGPPLPFVEDIGDPFGQGPERGARGLAALTADEPAAKVASRVVMAAVSLNLIEWG